MSYKVTAGTWTFYIVAGILGAIINFGWHYLSANLLKTELYKIGALWDLSMGISWLLLPALFANLKLTVYNIIGIIISIIGALLIRL